MKVFTTRADLKKYLESFREKGKIIGLVPTMGALHAGHAALVEYMRTRCDMLVGSIFVNPTQFNNKEDLETYPRTLDSDLMQLKESGCDVVFAPSVREMYPVEESWYLDLDGLDDVLEGAHRPGHFQGVTQVVKKLFDIVCPDLACFGQKDYQQALVIKRMIDIFNLPIQLLMVSTTREESGLALSSRNRRLSSEAKIKAAEIYKILSLVPGELEPYGIGPSIQRAIERYSCIPELTLEYLEIREQGSLRPIEAWKPTIKYVVLAAVWIEGVRLIDNILVPQSI